MMKQAIQRIAISAAACILSTGCGGGGGASTGANTVSPAPNPAPPSGDSAPPPVVNSPGLELTPAALRLSAYLGESIETTVGVKASMDFSGLVNVQVADLDGGFTSRVDLISYGPYTYFATLHTPASLTAGVHSGVVRIALCKDTPITCAQQHAGSPWKLPYSINVKPFAPATGLTTLATQANVLDWGGYQGDAAHTGRVALTVDPARITPRFSWFAPPDNILTLTTHSPVVTADGNAYFTSRGSVYALNEQSGALQWSAAQTGSWANVGHPSASQGKVFLPYEGGLNVYDTRTGAKVNYIGASLTPWKQPVVDGNDIYLRDNFSNALQYDYASGKQVHQWRNRSASSWSASGVPALDSRYMYYYSTGTIFQIARASGEIVSSIPTGRTQYDDIYANSPGAPVLHGDRRALFIEEVSYGNDTGLGTLFDADFATGAIRWSVRSKFRNNPVLAGDTVYALDDMRIVALGLADGAAKWSWAVPEEDKHVQGGGSLFNLLVVDNLLFAAFAHHVYAIDLATQKTVWTFDRGGWLTVSRNGVLYVASESGTFAFNLK